MIRDKDLELIVYEMRSRQKDYFKTRDTYYLNQSKHAEKRVDDYLTNQISMFRDKELIFERKLLNDFLTWRIQAQKDDPLFNEKDSATIIEMFLFECS